MSEDILTRLDKLVQKLGDVQKNIQDNEAQLKFWKERERELTEKEIPTLMQACGQKLLRTTSGYDIELKDEVFARIPLDKKEEAFDWLNQHNEGGMIKEEVVKRVHPQTLKAWVRTKLEEGTEIPSDLFGIYTRTVAKVK